MSDSTTESRTARDAGYRRAVTSRWWVVGLVGGLAGAFPMGLVMHFVIDFMPLTGAVYGMGSVLGGWIAHMVNGAVLGVVFAWLIGRPFIDELTNTATGIVGMGIGYGAFLGLATGGVVLPLAVNALAIEELPVPLLPVPGVIEPVTIALAFALSHLVYGAVLGATYAFLTGESLDDTTAAST